MNIAQYFITVKFTLGNNSDCQKIKYFIKTLVLFYHLVVDGIKMLRTAKDTERNIVRSEHFGYITDHILNLFISFLFLGFNKMSYFMIFFRIKIKKT